MSPKKRALARRIGDAIRVARAAAGQTQAQVAHSAKLRVATVSHYECGRRVPPTHHVVALAAALNVPAGDLLA